MLKPPEWDSLVDNLASGKTIICLGAELYQALGVQVDKALAAELKGVDHVRMYSDGLFHFQGSGDMTSYTRIKQFYNQDFPALREVTDQLAQLPIRVFLSANPDHQLERAFRRINRPYHYHYHHPNKPAQEIEEPTMKQPLIYNLLGDINQRESLILTHEDLFGFLISLVDGKSVSRVVTDHIQSAYNFIFLGLPFEKWYMKVLLHFLQRNTNKRAVKYAANYALDTEVQMFIIDEFQFTCVPTDVGAFVRELYSRWMATNPENLDAFTQPTSLFNKWIVMIANDQLEEGLEEMSIDLPGRLDEHSEAQFQLLQINGRLASFSNGLRKGTLGAEQAQLQRNQIRDSLLSFLNDYVKPLSV